MKNTLNNLISEFASENSLDQERVEELIINILTASVKPKYKRPKEEVIQKRRVTDKEISDLSRKEVRQFVKNEVIKMAKNFGVFSINGVAEKLNVSPYVVQKVIKECKEDNILKPFDGIENPGKGRMPRFFTLNQ